MSFGRFSDTLTTSWMDDVAARDKWLTLVFADPLAVSNPLTVELSDVRTQGTWVRTSNSLLTLSLPLIWSGLLAGAHVAGVAGFDAQVNGLLLFADLLDVPVDFPDGGAYTLPGGQFVLGIDVPGA